MTEPAQVIPYASTAKPKSSLSLGTILAIFAIAQAIPAFLNNTRLIEDLKSLTNSSTPSPAMVALYWLHLGSVFGLLAGAVLLLLRKRSVGSTLVAGVSVFDDFVAMPLYMVIASASPMLKGMSPIRQAGMWAQVSLNLTAAAAAIWLLCRLASQCRRAAVADGVSWFAVWTTCVWSILLFGLCQVAIVLVRMGQVASIHPGGIPSSAARPITVAATLLTIGGLAAVLHWPWSRRLGIIAAIAWALHPAATSVYSAWRFSDLSVTERFLSVAGIGQHIQHFPLAILWILLLTHPQIRACWGSRSDHQVVQ